MRSGSIFEPRNPVGKFPSATAVVFQIDMPLTALATTLRVTSSTEMTAESQESAFVMQIMEVTGMPYSLSRFVQPCSSSTSQCATHRTGRYTKKHCKNRDDCRKQEARDPKPALACWSFVHAVHLLSHGNIQRLDIKMFHPSQDSFLDHQWAESVHKWMMIRLWRAEGAYEQGNRQREQKRL